MAQVLVSAGLLAGSAATWAQQTPGGVGQAGAEREAGGTPAPPSGLPAETRRVVEHPEARVITSVSSGNIVLADRVTFSIQVEARPGLTVVWPVIGETLGGMRVVSSEESPATAISVTGVTRIRSERRFVLEPGSVGRAKTPAMEVRFKPDNGSGAVFAVAAAPLEIVVESVVAEGSKDDPGALRGVVSVESSNRLMWIAIAGGGAGVLAVGGLTLWAIGRKRTPVPASPLVLLRTRLRRVDEQASAGTGTAASMYEELAAVTRFYLAWRLGLGAEEQTTEELRPRLESEQRLGDRGARLGDLLARADLAKFGGARAGSTQVRQDVRLVEEAIDAAEAAVATQADPGRAVA